MADYINITPTWEEIAPALIAVLEDGSDHGRDQARREIIRMAKIADLYVKAQGKTEADLWREQHGDAAERRAQINTGGY